MLKSAPDRSSLTREFADCVGKYNQVARRLYQNGPDYKQRTLVRYKRLPTAGVFHPTLADAEMTAHLWLRMLENLGE
ncbi:hypothetical protein [Salinisphaera sp. G21_0]|uniref:hypothetical protein n=1 Tax=Salinisphaera sp. G21_0 TaxID=2821094 RepID=UPI001ADA22F2|nr:hypothetical protein [Salinisphaera sp. G21_0]MBO9479962.1 hypothetical protein [Salinisphaera sp. G21_0]